MPQIPQAATVIRTWSGPGDVVSTSTSVGVPPAAATCTARWVDIGVLALRVVGRGSGAATGHRVSTGPAVDG
ncbi:hypothetical protein G419_21704 [Rhodococcus triatomae BKS 15-14]|nr:hypothetical protein G419_21704 [Rhodococcus triatomae BKS 15-14]